MKLNYTNRLFITIFSLFLYYFINVLFLCRPDNPDVYLRSIVFNILVAYFLAIFFSFFKNKNIAFVFLIFIAGVQFANLVYIRFSGNPLAVTSILYASNTGHVTSSILPYIKFKDVLLLLPLLYFYFLVPQNNLNWTQNLKMLFYWAVVMFIFQYASYQNLQFYNSFKKVYSYNKTESSYKNTFLSNIIVEIVNWINEKKLIPDEINIYTSKIRNEYIHPLSDSSCKQNIIYILVEALESFPINKSFEGVEITPNLNSLIADSNNSSFLNVVPHVQIGRTSDAQIAINTGLFASRKRVKFQDYYKNDFICLAHILKKYNNFNSTLMCVGDRAGFYRRDSMAPSLGYDEIISSEKLDISDHFNIGISDESFFKQMIEVLKNKKKPYFAHLVTLSSHTPYEIPYNKQKIKFTKSNTFTKYLQSINYFDAALGQFLIDLKRSGLYDNTIIVINGDHEGIAGSDKVEAHHFLKNKDLLGDAFTVPLIVINAPNSVGIQNQYISQIDIFPTLIELLSIRSPWKGLGISAMSEKHPKIGVYASYTMYPKENTTYLDSFLSKWDLSEKILENNLLKGIK